MSSSQTMHHSRRAFMRLAVTLSGGLLFKFDSAGAGADVDGASKPFVPGIYVRIDPDNTVTVGLAKQEMGQGVETGLPMILADELGADWETLKVEPLVFDRALPGFRERFGVMETGGSSSMMESWDVLRQAGAMARETLILAAAQEWKVDPGECRAAHSRIHHDVSGRSATFGSLATAASGIEPPRQPRLKTPNEFTLIGRSLHARKNARVVQGIETYGSDVRLPGMVYAAIERAPVAGARVLEYDDSNTRKVAGVIATLKVAGGKGATPHWGFEEGVAVVATAAWAAFQGRRELLVTWDDASGNEGSDVPQRQRFAPGPSEGLQVLRSVGDIDKAMAGAAKTLEVTYETPYLPHNLMEPLTAVADVRNGTCEIHAGSQAPQYTANYLAQILGIPIENIRFHVSPSGGGFGRRFYADYVAEAAVISQSIGRPVMSVWSREDDIRHGRHHPMRHDHYRIAIDAADAWSGMDYVGVTTFFRPASIEPVYPVPHTRERQRQVTPAVNVGAWRSVAEHPRVFGQESIVDEVAAAVSADPFDFRIRLLSHPPETVASGAENDELRRHYARLWPRLLRVLATLRERSRWDDRRKMGRHCGVAVSQFHGSSVCGQVAEVVRTAQGLMVSQVTCVLDCGLVVNPQLVRAQVEGSILWALTAVLYGGITVRDGRVVESNFHDAPILKMGQVPKMDIFLMDSAQPPGKVGEAAVPPLAPAVANAAFAATGERVRSFPFAGFVR